MLNFIYPTSSTQQDLNMDEAEIIKQHFAKMGSKGGKAGTGESKRREGSAHNLKKYWEDVAAGLREPPKRRGRPPKTRPNTEDSAEAIPKEKAKKTKPPETSKQVADKPSSSEPQRTKNSFIDEEAQEMAQAVASGNMDRVIELRQRSNSRSAATKVGRNDPCPCGSGRKFKKCCGG
jgi:hypothetical protein